MSHPTFVAGQADYIARLNDLSLALDRRLLANVLYNGQFSAAQRGTVIAALGATKTYTLDRWLLVRGGYATGATVTQVSSIGLPGCRYAARVQRDSGNASVADISFSQSVPVNDMTQIRNRPLIFQFWARGGTNFSAASAFITAQIYSGNGVDGNLHAGFTSPVVDASQGFQVVADGSTWTKCALPLSTFPTARSQVAVNIVWTPTGTAGANDYVEISAAQLVVGTMCGDFLFTSQADELARCKAFYEKSYNYSTAPGSAVTVGQHGFVSRVADQLERVPVRFECEKYATPTVAIYNPSTGGAGTFRNVTGASNLAAAAADIGTSGFLAYPTANTTANNVYGFHWTADAEL